MMASTRSALNPVVSFARRAFLLLLSAAVLAGCASSKTALAPLPELAQQDRVDSKVVWSGQVGDVGGTATRFTPLWVEQTIYAADGDGRVSAWKQNQALWSVSLNTKLTAGVGGDGKTLVVADQAGTVIALAAASGQVLWRVPLNTPILAPPLANDDVVIVKTANQQLLALASDDGRRLWAFQRSNPALILRSDASPLFADDYILTGLPAGRIVAVRTSNGTLAWEGQVATPRGATELERVADIAAMPVKDNRSVCAVAYQGQISCFDMGDNGKKTWTRDIASSLGLSIYASLVFVSDDRGSVYGLSRNAGSLVWRQEALQSRVSTAPAPLGSVVAVGDREGYVHFLKTSSGNVVGRIATDGSPILAQPIARGNNVLVQTQKGGLYLIAVSQL